MNLPDMPGVGEGPAIQRMTSPSAASTLITSAPWSAMILAA